ncbi:MAG: peptidoglycan-binding protein [Candidatus Omnitrophota bacterium]
MKKIFALSLACLMLLQLAGCALFESQDQDLDSKVNSLGKRVDTIEQRQEQIEGQLREENKDIKVSGAVPVRKKEKYELTPAIMSNRDIQAALNNAGYYEGPVDGKLGSLSRKAIMDFQEAKGLKVDGIAGPETKKALLKHMPR